MDKGSKTTKGIVALVILAIIGAIVWLASRND